MMRLFFGGVLHRRATAPPGQSTSAGSSADDCAPEALLRHPSVKVNQVAAAAPGASPACRKPPTTAGG
jgi:hypothetical protein